MPTFTEGQLDRLEAWLLDPARGEDALLPDSLQGFLAAVVSAPQPIEPTTWLPVALGEKHAFASPEEEAAMRELLVAFRNDIAEQLNLGEHFDMVLYGEEDTEEREESLAHWCDGYLLGVDIADPPWDAEASEEDLDEMLFPFYALSGRWKQAVTESGQAFVDPAEERALMDEARKSLIDVILDNRAFWFEKAIPQTLRRDSPKIGRNDPCPCGSGKKYKQCHGA
jgi:uncharacterized protein